MDEQKELKSNMSKKVCVWMDDDDGSCQTGCSNSFEINDDTLADSGWLKYCPFCGLEITKEKITHE